MVMVDGRGVMVDMNGGKQERRTLLLLDTRVTNLGWVHKLTNHGESVQCSINETYK